LANQIEPAPVDPQDRYAIVVAQWNEGVTHKLRDGAIATLVAAGIPAASIDVAQVPGSWEIPLAAQRFAATGHYRAVICLGAVVRGETTHDEHLNRGVSLALGELALKYDLPIPLGVLTCQTMQQAIDRSGGRVGNKGSECAEAALQMVGLLKRIGHA
jgi:6,7-dimethyl-8-ribityllumazine synthase